MPRVKVLHVITRLIRGGGDENTLYTVNGLSPSRYQTTLLVGSQSETPMLKRVAPHVELIEVPELVREVSPRKDAVAFAKLYRLIGARRYHIVHTHMAKGGMIGRFAARAAHTPSIIHTIHGQTFHRHLHPAKFALYWSMEKSAGTFTDQMIAVGDELRQWYQSAGIASPSRYHVIPSGMDLRQFKEAAQIPADQKARIRASMGIPPDVPLVGKVARHTEGKGHEYFLEMAEQVLASRPDAHFVALGAGELLENFRDEVRRRGLSTRVFAAGFRKDIAQVLATLNVVVLASLWEGLPRVLVQASSVGIPVVTFDVGGAREVVQEGENGYIIPSKDVRTMAERVLQLIQAPDQARAMGKTGQTLIDHRWTIEHMVSHIEQVYEQALARPGPVRRERCGPI